MLISLNFVNLLSWLMMMTHKKWHCDCQLLLQFCGTAGIIMQKCRYHCIFVDAWLCVAKLVWKHLLQHFVKTHHANLVASTIHINNSHPSVGNFRRPQCSPAINALGMQFYCDASQHLHYINYVGWKFLFFLWTATYNCICGWKTCIWHIATSPC